MVNKTVSDCMKGNRVASNKTIFVDAFCAWLTVICSALLLLGVIVLFTSLFSEEIGNEYIKQMLASQISPVLTSSALIVGLLSSYAIVILNQVDRLKSFFLYVVRVSLSFVFTTTFFQSCSNLIEGNSRWSDIIDPLGITALCSVIFLFCAEWIVAFRNSEAYKEAPEFIESNFARWCFSGTSLLLCLGGVFCSIVEYSTQNYSGSTFGWFVSEYSVRALFAAGWFGTVVTLVTIWVTQNKNWVTTLIVTSVWLAVVSWSTLHLDSGFKGIETQVQQTIDSQRNKAD